MTATSDTRQHVTPGPSAAGRRPARRRRPVRRVLVWTHRWSSLILGAVLLAVTTTGAILLYEPELTRLATDGAYADVSQPTLTLPEALEVVAAHDPDFTVDSLNHAHGTYIAENFETGRTVHVDPADGDVLFDSEGDGHGAVVWVLDLAHNIHACALTCETDPGYQAWLLANVPVSSWAGFDGAPLTWGGLVLAITGLLLLFLAVSGAVLWWPGVRRWVHGVRVRWRGGRFARDRDLHQVIGMLAVPLLLLWAVTGMGFELGFLRSAWYAALPGAAPAEVTAVSDGSGPDIGAAAAITAAQRLLGPDAEVRGIDPAVADDPTATYTVWLAEGLDPYGRTSYPGDTGVAVDRYDGTAVVTFGGPDLTLSEQLWEQWNYPTHAGWVVDGWWRLLWLAAGLAPLGLAATGLSTWLYRRRTQRRRRATSAHEAVTA